MSFDGRLARDSVEGVELSELRVAAAAADSSIDASTCISPVTMTFSLQSWSLVAVRLAAALYLAKSTALKARRFVLGTTQSTSFVRILNTKSNLFGDEDLAWQCKTRCCCGVQVAVGGFEEGATFRD